LSSRMADPAKSKLKEKFDAADYWRRAATNQAATPPTYAPPPPPRIQPIPSILPPGLQFLERFSLRPKTVSSVFVTCCIVSMGAAAEATKWLAKTYNNDVLPGVYTPDSYEASWAPWDVYNPVGYHKIVKGYLDWYD